MKEERYQAIRAQKPDFVIVVSKHMDSQLITILSESGYHQCNAKVVENGKSIMKQLPIYAKK